MQIAEEKPFRYEVELAVHRGGVTDPPKTTLVGAGMTIAGAVKDALTARGATVIRDGDFLKVRVSERWW